MSTNTTFPQFVQDMFPYVGREFFFNDADHQASMARVDARRANYMRINKDTIRITQTAAKKKESKEATVVKETPVKETKEMMVMTRPLNPHIVPISTIAAKGIAVRAVKPNKTTKPIKPEKMAAIKPVEAKVAAKPKVEPVKAKEKKIQVKVNNSVTKKIAKAKKQEEKPVVKTAPVVEKAKAKPAKPEVKKVVKEAKPQAKPEQRVLKKESIPTPPKLKAVNIAGKAYSTAEDAAKLIKLPLKTVISRLGNPKFKDWNYVDERSKD